jgi:hypothetical protein
LETAACVYDDDVEYGDGAGALYEGGTTADGGDTEVVVDMVEVARISYNVDGGTEYEDCVDEYDVFDDVASDCTLSLGNVVDVAVFGDHLDTE